MGKILSIRQQDISYNHHCPGNNPEQGEEERHSPRELTQDTPPNQHNTDGRNGHQQRHRPHEHPRYGQEVTRDDVIAQPTFGAWDQLLGANLPRNATESIQQHLWEKGLSPAFPNLRQDDEGRQQIAARIKRVRKLRNRAVHSENLLNVGPEKRLTDMLSTLSAIDEEFTAWSMNGSRYRAVVRRPIH